MSWTVDEAARELDPPMTAQEVRALITCCRIPSTGPRRGRLGRPALEYHQDDILRAHAAVAPWLVRDQDAERRADRARS